LAFVGSGSESGGEETKEDGKFVLPDQIFPHGPNDSAGSINVGAAGSAEIAARSRNRIGRILSTNNSVQGHVDKARILRQVVEVIVAVCDIRGREDVLVAEVETNVQHIANRPTGCLARHNSVRDFRLLAESCVLDFWRLLRHWYVRV
jgi:hypothetical protein